jgi:NADPH2:quinone reductase
MQTATVTAYGDPDTIELREADRPTPGPGEVTVEVKAAGVNFADTVQRRGHYRGGPTPPYTPGMEVAGVVDAVGDGVGREVGDRVTGFTEGGGYAEYAVANAAGLLDAPEGMGFAEAAGVPVQFLTAHNCLHEWGGLEAGERVLVHAAAGGVGTAAVQIAREADAEVFGTASTESKLELAAELGCDHPIQYTAVDFAERINELTDATGVDLVLDSVGGETTARSLDCLSEFGRLVAFGAASGEPGRPSTEQLLFANQTVHGYHLGRAMEQVPSRVLAAVPKLTNLLEAGDVRVVVGREFDLAEAAEAHRLIENRESSGKVVLRP